MRFLYVVEGYPWPERSGARVRQVATIEGLARNGSVSLLVLQDGVGEGRSTASMSAAARLRLTTAELAVPSRSVGSLERLRWLVNPTVPSELLEYDTEPLLARARAALTIPFDQVWYARPRAFHLVGPWPGAPAVVDFDDLEEVEMGSEEAGGGALAELKRRRGSRGSTQLRAAIAANAAAVTVCSESDRDRFGAHNVHVIPNSYPPVDPNQPSVHGTRPRVLVPGLFTNGPNADGARWAVERVLPHLRRIVPDVELRLVGRAPESLLRLDGLHVTVAGEVDNMSAEVAAADAVLVPIHTSGGTRVRILEAFAHRRPVVTTRCGAEGLPVVDGVHLRLADQPEDMARALASILLERPLADRLALGGHRLWRTRFTRDIAVERVRDLVQRVAREQMVIDLDRPGSARSSR